MKTGEVYEFGAFRLDLDEQSLSKNGEIVRVTPKVYSLLKCLVESSGNVVTKDDLMETIWEGNIVEDSNLTFTIRQLRIALDDNFKNPVFVETIPRRGYRFIGELREVKKVENERKLIDLINLKAPDRLISRHGSGKIVRAVVLGITLILVLSGIFYIGSQSESTIVGRNEKKTLAVLPFKNIRPNSDYDYLGFAFADTLNTKLTSMNTFRVFPSSLMAKYNSPQDFLTDQKSDYIVTGTYLNENGKLKINSQVFNVLKNETLFQDSFEISDEELSFATEIISRRLINELRLRPKEISKYADMSEVNPKAYNYFLKGIEQYSRSRLAESIDNLEKAVAIEPTFSVAWDKLGDSYLVSASTRFGGAEYYEKAEICYRRAISIDGNNTLPQLHLTNNLTETDRIPEAMEILLKLQEKEPENPIVWWELSYAYRFAGRLEKSIEAGEKAHQVDPGFFLNASAPNYYLYVSDYQKFKNSMSNRTDSAYIKFYQGFADYHLNDMDSAKKLFDEAFQLDSNSMQTQIGKALSYHIANENDKANEILIKIEREIVEKKVSDGEGIYKVAQAFAILGESKKAIELFQLAIEKGFYSYPYFLSDPLMNNVRNEKKFEQVLAMGKTKYDDFTE